MTPPSRRRRTDRTLANLARRIERGSEIVPHVEDHLVEQLAHVRIIGASDTSGERSASGPSDPTGTAADRRELISRHRHYIGDAIEAIGVAVDLLDQCCRDALGVRGRDTTDDRTAFEVVEAPICRASGCDQPVSSFRRADGSTGYRMGGEGAGYCDTHRRQVYRGRAS